ncbi:MAG: SUMF1/EgtB/PvdO family nonheme iron enzyme [Candidatus Delongbacteria bacterium]|jgi:sulfatase modifying factor 1|nr:SUMF1/EgtB/PvdO family nonheme iron enzyme [Candidatus Delongbacteria bacterium]
MPKLAEKQLNALKKLPYWIKLKDIVNLYEVGILSQDKFNDEILKARREHKPDPKLTEKQLNALKELPYWNKILDLIKLYKVGVITQEILNDEILKTKMEYKPESGTSYLGIEMVYVEGGVFQMGKEKSENGCRSKPVHAVKINDFHIGKFQITQKQYESIMSVQYNYHEGCNNPIEMISWYNTIKYCNLRSIAEGFTPCYTIFNSTNPTDWGSPDSSWNAVICNWEANGYRLLTEAEWEYAAKGGLHSKGYEYSGSNIANEVAWCKSNSSVTHTVGTKIANELGIYDMSGNVWEWCWDWYGLYSNELQNNPIGPVMGETRVQRGGSYESDDYDLTCTIRGYCSSYIKIIGHSFRIARTKL